MKSNVTMTLIVLGAANYAARLKPKAVIPIHYGSIVGNKADGHDFKEELEKIDGGIQVEVKLR